MNVALTLITFALAFEHLLNHFLDVACIPFLLYLAPLLHNNIFKPETQLVLA